MKIETVTTRRPYQVITCDGKVTFNPGDVLTVIGLRYSGSIEFMSVIGKGLKFDIPSDETTTVSELALT